MVKYIILFLCVLTLDSQANMHRRARHFNARDAGATLVLDSRFITGLADGDPVSTWSDRSGNGNDASQSNATKRPTLKTKETGGQSVVRFDGSNDFLIGNTSITTSTFSAVFLVKRTAGRLGNITNNDGDDFDSAQVAQLGWNSSNADLGIYRNNAASATQSTSTIDWFLFTVVFDGSNVTTYVNSSNPISGTSTGNFNSNRYRLGSVVFDLDPLNGDMAVALHGTFSLSNSIRRRIEQAAALSFKIPCN
jgi:hypothetical protein